MSDLILPGEPPIEVILRRSARARRLSLRVSSLDGRVTLTCPMRFPEREAWAFAREKEPWLRKHLENRPDTVVPQLGGEIMFRGAPLRIEAGKGRMLLADGVLRLPVRDGRVAARVQGFLKQAARDRLVLASDRYAAMIGRGYSRITLRDTRSRWGSCSSRGALMYSWRLIMAPDEVLDYVAAHEVAHLVHMDHSTRFWGQVEELYGDTKTARKWLRQEGPGLHRYRFED